MNLTHLNFDTETLGLRENTVVTALSCVPFEFESSTDYDQLVLDGFFVKFDIQEQIKKYGRTTDASTIEWWSQQSTDARKQSIYPTADDVSLVEGLEMLTEFIQKNTDYNPKKSYVWCRGNYFDFPKIESLFRDADMEVPFNTWKIRDTRTLIDILTGVDNGQYDLENGIPKSFVKHHALHDAALDCARMIEIYRKIHNGEL